MDGEFLLERLVFVFEEGDEISSRSRNSDLTVDSFVDAVRHLLLEEVENLEQFSLGSFETEFVVSRVTFQVQIAL